MRKCKVWYNPDMGGFELFDLNGELIPGCGRITVNDGWAGANGFKLVATVEIQIEFVNEQPKKNRSTT